jgi:putative transposase
MKKSRYTENQIIGILKEADAGIKIQDLCRAHGISVGTYYQWRSKFGGMETSDIKRLREVESELSQYKKMYAELAHENYALRDVIAKKF